MSQATLAMLAALSAEMLLVLFALLGASWWRNRAARRRDAAAIRALVARVRQGRAERQAAIGRFVGDRLGMSGEAAQRVEAALWRAELILMQRFASVYRQRDAGAAALFDTDVVAALEPYHGLEGLAAASDCAEAGPIDIDELERLRTENARLSDELRVTMETMSRMLNEYSTMFAGAENGGADGAPRAVPPDTGMADAGVAGEAGPMPDVSSPELPEERAKDAETAPGGAVHLDAVVPEAGGTAAPKRDDDADSPPPASVGDQPADLLEEGAVEVVGFDDDIDDVLPPDDDGDPFHPNAANSVDAINLAFDDAASPDPQDDRAEGERAAVAVEASRVNSGR